MPYKLIKEAGQLTHWYSLIRVFVIYIQDQKICIGSSYSSIGMKSTLVESETHYTFMKICLFQESQKNAETDISEISFHSKTTHILVW